MKKNLTKKAIVGALAAISLLWGAGDAYSTQGNFTNNTGGTYNAAATGVIRMKQNSGQLDGTAALGATAGTRVPGTVIWMCIQPNIAGPKYYTNLATEGGNKTFTGDIYVSGTYDPQGPGTRTYTGTTFHFDGTGATAQVIPGENTTNGGGFDNVALTGAAPKEVAANTTVVINGLTHQDGTLTNQGTLVLGAKPSTSTGDIVNNVPAAGTGGITIGTGAVTVNNYTNTNGSLTIPSGGTINVNGTFVHTAGNMAFDCNSNFNYTGTTANQVIAATGATGFPHYGNLGVSNSTKVAGGNVNVCNNYVASSELDMAPGTNNYTLTMENTTNANHATYTGGVEVRGNMQYNNLATGTEYTYNNAETKVTFEIAPTTFAMDIRQQTAPNTKLNDYQATQDINRKINITYTGTGRISNIATMWEDADATSIANPATTLPRLRLAEGWDATKARKKSIRVGATYAVNTTNRTISYGIAGSADGINLPGSTAYGDPTTIASTRSFLSGSDLVLSTAIQKVISIANGRWSNPATWDAGVVPNLNDDVDINTVVWVGDERALFGGAAFAGNEIDGAVDGDAGAAANSITILNGDGKALFISNQDPNMSKRGSTNEIVFRTKTEGAGTGIFNTNTTANTATPETNTTTPAGFNGIWISSVTGSYSPVLGGSQITNGGPITNNGFLEVGICQ